MPDQLSLNDLRFDCIVGVYPHERHTPQPLVLDLTLLFDTRPAAATGSLKHSVDYARLWGEVRFILHAGRFALLESAAEAVARYLLAPPTPDVPRVPIQEAKVRLRKPNALGGTGFPSLEIHRRAGDMTYPPEPRLPLQGEVVFASPECGVYREYLQPGQSVGPLAVHHAEVWELVLGAGLELQGRPAPAGTAHCWPTGTARGYHNPTSEQQTLLRVDRPGLHESHDREASESTGEAEPVVFFRP